MRLNLRAVIRRGHWTLGVGPEATSLELAAPAAAPSTCGDPARGALRSIALLPARLVAIPCHAIRQGELAAHTSFGRHRVPRSATTATTESSVSRLPRSSLFSVATGACASLRHIRSRSWAKDDVRRIELNWPR